VQFEDAANTHFITLHRRSAKMDSDTRRLELDHITAELDEVRQAIKQLINDMLTAPPEQRIGANWGATGTYATRMLSLLARQEELGKTLITMLQEERS
jgi:hypothetical protein